MADYSVSALTQLKKEIAHKAIQTVLYWDYQWDGSSSEGFHGAGWEGTLPPVDGPTGTVQLKWRAPLLSASAGFPPGITKVGDDYDAMGQPYTIYEIDPWESIYSPWIERIDTAFQGWDTIPDPADFEGPIERVRAAVSELMPLPTDGGGNDTEGDFSSAYTSVDLDTNLGTMDAFIGGQTAGADDGLLVFAFRQGYGPDRIRGVMANQAQAAILLGVALLAEQRTWRGARKDIMAIAEAAKDAMRPGGAGGDSIDLETVKAFADLIGSFAPAPISKAIDIGQATLDVVGTLVPESKPNSSVQLSGYTCDEVYQSMCEAIEKLEKKVYEQEYELAYTSLSGLLDYMSGNAASQFHIHPKNGIDVDLAEARPLSQHTEYLQRIGYQTVPTIAAYMLRAAEDLQAANRPGIWQRDNMIGLGNSGAYPQWYDVLEEFDNITSGSARELVEAGKLLAIGAGYVAESDQWSRDILHGLQDDLERGETGWDNQTLGEEVTPTP